MTLIRDRTKFQQPIVALLSWSGKVQLSSVSEYIMRITKVENIMSHIYTTEDIKSGSVKTSPVRQIFLRANTHTHTQSDTDILQRKKSQTELVKGERKSLPAAAPSKGHADTGSRRKADGLSANNAGINLAANLRAIRETGLAGESGIVPLNPKALVPKWSGERGGGE